MGDMPILHNPCMAMAAACGHLVDETQVGLGMARGNECIERPYFRSTCSRGAMAACESAVDNMRLEDTDNRENPCRLPLLAARQNILNKGATREDHTDH